MNTRTAAILTGILAYAYFVSLFMERVL